MTTDEAHAQTRHETSAQRRPVRRARLFVLCAVVFLVALGVRALHWQDSRHAFIYEGMAVEYKEHALLLYEGDVTRFVRGDEWPLQASIIKHPPGYPLLLAAVYSVFGVSDTPVRALHIVLDALAAVLVLLLALELFGSAAVATIAGLLVALSPQFAYHSIALVPDPLAAPPILLAFYLLARTGKRPRLMSVAAAGAMIGVSCWLRSNALLLAPFVALLAPLLFERGRRLRPALVLAAAGLLVIVPVTIRNAVVYKAFIPLSLSAGITLVEGIGIYDREGRFGLPSSDYAVTKWEAEMYGRPDYLGSRFDPDGVERERSRISHGLAVVRAHPFWFLRVMAHRAASMWRLARVEIVAAEPAVANAPNPGEGERPAWTIEPSGLTKDGDTAAQSELRTTGDSSALRFAGEQMGTLVVSPPVAVQKNTDYLLRLPLKIEQGSIVVEVRDARRDAVLASTPILHPIDYLDFTRDTQPAVNIMRPFVSGDAEEVRVVVRNASQRPVAAEAGRVEGFALGPSAHAWTRPVRLLVRGAQKLFLTAFVLPFIILGLFLLVRARRWGAIALLLSVPVYYMCTQSALWTEFRYILPMHYFLFILAALGLQQTFMFLRRAVLKLRGGRVA
ncbi:MAG TPA: glycosyltransferase family 39 protein [Pyrinomonadaceae bacterium]